MSDFAIARTSGVVESFAPQRGKTGWSFEPKGRRATSRDIYLSSIAMNQVVLNNGAQNVDRQALFFSQTPEVLAIQVFHMIESTLR